MSISELLHIANSERLYFHAVVTLLLWFIMFLSILIDLWDGIYTAKFLGEKIKSHTMRHTFQKAGEYWRLMLFGLLFDVIGLLFTWYILPFMTMIITLGVLIIEFRSMMEHSKKRKSHAAELPDVIAEIIKAASRQDALEIIHMLKDKEDINYETREMRVDDRVDHLYGQLNHPGGMRHEKKSRDLGDKPAGFD